MNDSSLVTNLLELIKILTNRVNEDNGQKLAKVMKLLKNVQRTAYSENLVRWKD